MQRERALPSSSSRLMALRVQCTASSLYSVPGSQTSSSGKAKSNPGRAGPDRAEPGRSTRAQVRCLSPSLAVQPLRPKSTRIMGFLGGPVGSQAQAHEQV
ncbi:hypothetical protein NL676_027058 [Syzygium grande]|nr:hypothetical protein NL676_027058 [Syzygium grande]